MDRGQKFQLTSSNLIIIYILNCEFYLIYLISIFFLKGVVILPYGSDRYPVMKLALKTVVASTSPSKLLFKVSSMTLEKLVNFSVPSNCY